MFLWDDRTVIPLCSLWTIKIDQWENSRRRYDHPMGIPY
jgi:hypothetical protein